MIFKAKNIMNKICQNKKQTDSIGMLVPLSNLLRHIQSGQISSHEEIEKIIDEAIVLLKDFKSAAHEDLNQSTSWHRCSTDSVGILINVTECRAVGGKDGNLKPRKSTKHFTDTIPG